MNNETDIEKKIANMLGASKNTGFKKPPADYFDQFTNRLPLQNIEQKKSVMETSFKINWFIASSFAAAAIVLLAVWLFVFDANIGNRSSFDFTYEELIALNDFDHYNEDMLYTEMASLDIEEINTKDLEVDALLNMGTLSSDDLIELYLNEDIK